MSQQDGSTAVAELHLADRTRTVSLADLEQMKASLAAALARGNPEDFAPLSAELADARCVVDGDGIAHIGVWELTVDRGEALLERQQFPRAPVMLFHVAPLVFAEGRWRVSEVRIKKVLGR